jgi:SAM-dependent methyltransferase
VSTFVERRAREVLPGARVLDAGAGEGRYRPLFAGTRYVAVDLAVGDPAWDYGRLDARADLGRLPFAGASFDHVLSTQTLEHLADPGGFLAEAHRVLRPGGTLFLTAPMLFRMHQEPHDYFRYTRHGLALLLGRAGFAVESITPQGGYFWFLADAIRPLHRRLFGKERPFLFRALAAPLVLVSKFLFTALLPWVLFRLDGLDTKRTTTTGHEVVARRPE